MQECVSQAGRGGQTVEKQTNVLTADGFVIVRGIC